MSSRGRNVYTFFSFYCITPGILLFKVKHGGSQDILQILAKDLGSCMYWSGLGWNTFYQIQIQIQKFGFFKYKYKYFAQVWFKYKYKYIDSNTNTNTFNQIYLPKLFGSKIGQFYKSQDICSSSVFPPNVKVTFAFQEISLALNQLLLLLLLLFCCCCCWWWWWWGTGTWLWDRNAQYCPLTRNDIKGQKGESALYISPNFTKKVRNTAFPHFSQI